ncbi:hypothetical protein ACQ4PT_025669 [Festuca glaucescens]
MVQLEEDLSRAVMVTIVGHRPEVTPDAAAEVIRSQLALEPADFSIRAFELADFLILCRSTDVRDAILQVEVASSSLCTLHLAPWSRRAGATLREAPFLADLEIRGIPAHAWAERTAVKLLEGAGIVDEVAPATANRSDMSCFKLAVWTHDITSIPAVRWLAVPEPGHGDRLLISTGRHRPRTDTPKLLWYRISFWVSSWLIGGGAVHRRLRRT